MVEVKEGMIIDFSGAKTGNGSRGPYAKVEVKAEKGYDKIQVWAANPEDAQNIRGTAKVGKIKSAKVSAHQYEGKWYTDFMVNAELFQGEVRQVTYEPVDMSISDDELPFK